MSKKRALILLLSAILLGFLMIQPFNYICRLTDKCYPIILSYYLPKSTSKERYEVFFMTKEHSKDFQFKALEPSKIVAAGGDVAVVYNVKNTSDHDIKVRPMPYIEPASAEKYIEFYECLCFREHKIKAGEDKDFIVRMRLKREIEADAEFKDNRVIVVGYEL